MGGWAIDALYEASAQGLQRSPLRPAYPAMQTQSYLWKLAVDVVFMLGGHGLHLDAEALVLYVLKGQAAQVPLTKVPPASHTHCDRATEPREIVAVPEGHGVVVAGGAHGTVVPGPTRGAEALQQAGGPGQAGRPRRAVMAGGGPVEGVVLAHGTLVACRTVGVVPLVAPAVRYGGAPEQAVRERRAALAEVRPSEVVVHAGGADDAHRRGRRVEPRDTVAARLVPGAARAVAAVGAGGAHRIPCAGLPCAGRAHLAVSSRTARVAGPALAIEGGGAPKGPFTERAGAGRAGAVASEVLVVPLVASPASVWPCATVARQADTRRHGEQARRRGRVHRALHARAARSEGIESRVALEASGRPRSWGVLAREAAGAAARAGLRLERPCRARCAGQAGVPDTAHAGRGVVAHRAVCAEGAVGAWVAVVGCVGLEGGLAHAIRDGTGPGGQRRPRHRTVRAGVVAQDRLELAHGTVLAARPGVDLPEWAYAVGQGRRTGDVGGPIGALQAGRLGRAGLVRAFRALVALVVLVQAVIPGVARAAGDRGAPVRRSGVCRAAEAVREVRRERGLVRVHRAIRALAAGRVLSGGAGRQHAGTVHTDEARIAQALVLIQPTSRKRGVGRAGVARNLRAQGEADGAVVHLVHRYADAPIAHGVVEPADVHPGVALVRVCDHPGAITARRRVDRQAIPAPIAEREVAHLDDLVDSDPTDVDPAERPGVIQRRDNEDAVGRAGGEHAVPLHPVRTRRAGRALVVAAGRALVDLLQHLGGRARVAGRVVHGAVAARRRAYHGLVRPWQAREAGLAAIEPGVSRHAHARHRGRLPLADRRAVARARHAVGGCRGSYPGLVCTDRTEGARVVGRVVLVRPGSARRALADVRRIVAFDANAFG
eukprot:752302-Hanusia_phi.AAC.15